MSTEDKKITGRKPANKAKEPKKVAPGIHNCLPTGKRLEDMSLAQQVALAQRNGALLHKHYLEEEQVEVRIAPLYKDYFGNKMCVEVQGFKIWIPCDNRPHKIPKSFAMEVASRIRRTDDYLTKTDRMSNVTANYDGQLAGSLPLIKKA